MSDASEFRRAADPRAPGFRQRANRILLADDDADTRALVAEWLRSDGHEVVEQVDGGRLLVDVAAVYSPSRSVAPVDLIVSDIRMPICSGLDILAAIRDARWLTPVILMTAFSGDSVRERAGRLGAVLFEKPFSIDDLRTKVHELLAA